MTLLFLEWVLWKNSEFIWFPTTALLESILLFTDGMHLTRKLLPKQTYHLSTFHNFVYIDQKHENA